MILELFWMRSPSCNPNLGIEIKIIICLRLVLYRIIGLFCSLQAIKRSWFKVNRGKISGMRYAALSLLQIPAPYQPKGSVRLLEVLLRCDPSCPSVGRSVGWSICQIFLKGREVTLNLPIGALVFELNDYSKLFLFKGQPFFWLMKT